MRIISGIYKGRQISPVEGLTARPTTDFIREVTFSTLYSLNHDLHQVLDLYAGSGLFGFEALSRGASQVTFVDASKKAVSTMINNAKMLNCLDRCQIVNKKVDVFLPKVGIGPYDIIFLDPPYDKGLVNITLDLIFTHHLLTAEGLIVVEHARKEEMDPRYRNLVVKNKVHGHTVITIMQKKTKMPAV